MRFFEGRETLKPIDFLNININKIFIISLLSFIFGFLIGYYYFSDNDIVVEGKTTYEDSNQTDY